MAWSQVTPGCKTQPKKSSVLAFFRHIFVVCDIFGSKKKLCPAWVLGSAALLLAALSVENPGPSAAKNNPGALTRSRLTNETGSHIAFALLWRALCNKFRAALRESCGSKSCGVASCDIFRSAENPPSCLSVMVWASNLPGLYTLISKILRPACLVSKY